jgi:hypothetical protein
MNLHHTTADDRLKGMLQAAGLPVKASYTQPETALILGVSERTVQRMTAEYEPDEHGLPRNPGTLDSTMSRGGWPKISYAELVAYLERNRTYTRRHAVDPRQIELFAAS